MKKIAIHGVPRSGTSWLGSIFDSSPETIYKLQPLFSYAFKGFIDEKSSSEKINSFFELIKDSGDEFINQTKNKQTGAYPTFFKNINIDAIVYKEARYHSILENMLAQCRDVKVVGIIRNPFGVINSFFNAPKEFRRELGWDEIEEWRFAKKKNMESPENYYGYEKWKEVTKLFIKLQQIFPQNFRVVKYEDLTTNTLLEVKNIFAFCELEVSQQTTDYIDNSKKTHSDDAYAVFRNNHRHDAWKENLAKTIIEEIRTDNDFIKINSIIKWDI